MSKSKRYMIYGGVCLAMAGSIFMAGFFGPMIVGAALELAARHYEKKIKGVRHS